MAEERTPDLSAMLGQLLSDPKTMSQVMQMANTLFSSDAGTPAQTEKSPDPPPAAPPAAPVFSGGGPQNAETALLRALKPYLRPSRAERIDAMLGMLQAVKMLGIFAKKE